MVEDKLYLIKETSNLSWQRRLHKAMCLYYLYRYYASNAFKWTKRYKKYTRAHEKMRRLIQTIVASHTDYKTYHSFIHTAIGSLKVYNLQQCERQVFLLTLSPEKVD